MNIIKKSASKNTIFILTKNGINNINENANPKEDNKDIINSSNNLIFSKPFS